MSLYEKSIEQHRSQQRKSDYPCEKPANSWCFEPDENAPPQQCASRAAISLCTTGLPGGKPCPKLTRCLEEAILKNYDDGIWGGKTPEQRQELTEQDEFYTNLAKYSITKLSRIYGIKRTTVSGRLNQHPEMSIRTALLTKNMQSKPTKIGDTIHPTLTAAAKATGVSHATIIYRKKIGADLSAPKQNIIKQCPVTTSDGLTHDSRRKAAEHLGITNRQMRYRVENGLDPEVEPIGTRIPVATPYKDYRSVAAASDAFGKNKGTVSSRRHRGMTIEEALTTPTMRTNKKKPVVHHKMFYSSLAHAARENNVHTKTISRWADNRINGWSYHEPK
jgi:hypothetical protein